MSIIHDLKLKSRSLGTNKLISWDGLHNAHNYKIFKDGILYLESNSNRSRTVPPGVYQVYAETWQNDESYSQLSIIPKLSYTLNFNFNFSIGVGATYTRNETLTGIYDPKNKNQHVKKVIYESQLTLTYLLSLSIISVNSTSLVFSVAPRVKVLSYTNAKTYKTNIILPSTNLTINY